MVALESIGKTKVVELFTHQQEVQAGFLADQAQANPGVGPAAADGLGDTAVVGGQAARGPAVSQEFIEALPRPGAPLAADPAQVGRSPPR